MSCPTRHHKQTNVKTHTYYWHDSQLNPSHKRLLPFPSHDSTLRWWFKFNHFLKLSCECGGHENSQSWDDRPAALETAMWYNNADDFQDDARVSFESRHHHVVVGGVFGTNSEFI